MICANLIQLKELSDDVEFCYRNWRQFWVLLWKYWLLEKKFIFTNIFYYITVIATILFFVIFRSMFAPKFSPNATTYDSFYVTPTLIDDLPFPPSNLILAHFPNTTLVASIMNRSATIMGVKNPISTLYSDAVC